MLKKDWKKNLLRVKQMADQNLGRAEKSEVLSEDLQEIEKRVDQVKQAFKQTHTKLAACMQGQGLDPEKRRRKMPETLLASTLMDSAGLMSSDSLLAKMFGFCGSATGRVAEAHLKYEVDVENNILNQLHHILEQDIPAIMKLRKQLTKVTLDMDSARTRYQSANKQTHTGNSGASKVETIREEMEDAEMRVEQLKDQIATDMYQFMAQDKVYSQILVDFVQYQAEYHRQALAELEQVLPAMLEETNCTEQMPVFGQALEDHLMRTRRDISSVIEDCVITLKHIGMDEEGLFRVTGSSSKIKRLKSSFDAGMNDMEEYIHDIHCVAAALKLYLRELPEPLMTFRLYDDWMHAAHLPMDQRLQAYWLVLDKMPKANYNNLRYLIKFLAKLAENQELNKMSASNIAIVMGPNLLWPHGEGGPSVLTTGTQSAIVESLVTHADWFFPGEIDFHMTSSSSSSPVLIPTNNGASDHDQELASGASSSSSEPVAMGTLTHSTSASTSARAPSPGPMISSPQNSLNSMSTSTGSLTEAGSERLSPKVQRRVTRKPPAPLPPMPPERHPSQEKTFPESVAVAEPSTPSFTISPPEEKLADRNSLERPVVPNRPPIPPEKPTSPRHDRPKVPPPDRPHGPPPDKPEKPPMYRHERSSSNPPLPTITPAPQRCTSNPGANKPERPEKPGLPPPPASFQRQGSGRPPRPQPPPPHPPDRRTSQESVNKAPLAQQEPASDKTDHPAENLDTKL